MKIPTLDAPQVQSSAAPQAKVAYLQRTGMQDIGQALGQVGRVVHQVQIEERNKADQAAVMDADVATSQLTNELYNQAASTQLKDAIGVAPKALQDFDTQTGEIEKGLKNDRQKRVYQQQRAQARLNFQKQVETHERNQTEAYYTKSRNDYQAQQFTNAVTSYSDPQLIEQAQANLRASIEQTPGLDADQKKLEFADKSGKLYGAAIERYLVNDQVAAGEAYYKSVKDKISGDALTKIENDIRIAKSRIDSAKRANMSELKAELRESMDNVLAATEDGKIVSYDDLPDRGQLITAYGREKGDRYYRQMVDAANLSAEIQVAHAMPNEVLKAELAKDAAQKREGDVSSAAADQSLRRIKDAVLKNIITQRETDPAGYIINTNPVAERAFNDIEKELPGSGERYFRAVSSERERLGIQSTEILPPVRPGSNEWQTVALLSAKEFTELPKSASEWASAGLRSDDPEALTRAARFSAQVEELGASSTIGADEKTTAVQADRLLNSGASAESVAKTIKESRNVPDEVRKQRVAKYSNTKNGFIQSNKGVLSSYVDKEFDPGFFSSQPDVPVALQWEFDDKVGRYYTERGDIDTARDRAWMDIKRVYSPSRVNGGYQLMLLPPERFHVKPELVRKEITELIEANPQVDGSTPDEIVLVPTSKTMRQIEAIMGGQKVPIKYRLITKTGDAVLVNGKEQEYQLPDIEEATRAAIAEQKAVDEEKIIEAKGTREFIKQMEQSRRRDPFRGPKY